MISSSRSFVLFLTIFSLCFLTACEKDWDLLVVDDKEGKPVFCFSSFLGQCTGKGDRFVGMNIQEMGPNGERLQEMWSIVCDLSSNVDNCVLKRLEYGVLPHGWKQIVPAMPLSSNTYYLVNNYYYFYRNDEMEYSVLRRGEFHKKRSEKPK